MDKEFLMKMAFEKPQDTIRPPWYDHFIGNKSQYYRTYFIPKTELKKKIDKGYRLPYPKDNIPFSERKNWRKICAPVDLLKETQVKIRDLLYRRKPSKIDCCVKGKNRYDAMRVHAGNPIVLGMDIKDAFPSVGIEMIKIALNTEKFESSDIEFISELSTLNGVLPQGSPCSPALLNIVRKPLDKRLSRYVETRFNGIVSVYVDNYFISSEYKSMNNAIPAFKDIAKTSGFIMNNNKIYIMRKGNRIGGLGLVISKQPSGIVTVQPNKKYRDKIRAILHQALRRLESGNLPRLDFDLDQIKGMVETTKGSVYYGKFKSQIAKAQELLSSFTGGTGVTDLGYLRYA
jgi:hypothetical protein